jgi:hypothetical protein
MGLWRSIDAIRRRYIYEEINGNEQKNRVLARTTIFMEMDTGQIIPHTVGRFF